MKSTLCVFYCEHLDFYFAVVRVKGKLPVLLHFPCVLLAFAARVEQGNGGLVEKLGKLILAIGSAVDLLAGGKILDEFPIVQLQIEHCFGQHPVRLIIITDGQ